MKRAVTGLLAYAALPAVSMAADLPARIAPPVVTLPPAFTWTGAYAGLNAGYAWSDDHATTRPFSTQDLFTTFFIEDTKIGRVAYDQAGFTGGGQVGYNYQLTPESGVVFGFEADAQYMDLMRHHRSSSIFVFDNPLLPPGSSFDAYEAASKRRLDFLGTVRGRLGYAFDRVLLYGTGGFAYGHAEYQFALSRTLVSGGPFGGFIERGLVVGNSKGMQIGYVFGGGIEYALPNDSLLNVFRADAMTLKAEYLHYDLGTNDVVGALPSGIPRAVAKVRTDGDLVRAGVNYKFDMF